MYSSIFKVCTTAASSGTNRVYSPAICGYIKAWVLLYKVKLCTLLYLESVLQQLLVVLTECIAQPFEVISRLGCSCIR